MPPDGRPPRRHDASLHEGDQAWFDGGVPLDVVANAEQEPSAAQLRRRRALAGLLGVLSLLSFALTFTAIGSIVGLWRLDRVAMSSAGCGPLLFALLLYAWQRRRFFRRRLLTLLLVIDALLLAAMIWLLPAALRRGLERHGDWWVSAITDRLGIEGEIGSSVRAATARVADLLPRSGLLDSTLPIAGSHPTERSGPGGGPRQGGSPAQRR